MFSKVFLFYFFPVAAGVLLCGATSGEALGHNYLDISCNRCGSIVNFEMPDCGYDGSEVSIVFYHPFGKHMCDSLDEAIQQFNIMYPNIHIAHQNVGDYNDIPDIVSNELTTTSTPNIAVCYSDHVASYCASDYVVDLDQLIASRIQITTGSGETETLGLTSEQIDAFIDAFYLDGCQYGDNSMYSIPLARSTAVLYYDKDFFDEHALSIPTTWDEMEALCSQILQIDPDSIPLGILDEGSWFVTMCQQYSSAYTNAGSNHYLFDNETNQSFMVRFAEWYEKGYITTKEIYGNYTAGQYMRIDLSSSTGYYQDWDVTTIPQINLSNPKVWSVGPNLCIFQSKDPQKVIASWLFVKYLTTCVEFQAKLSMNHHYMPVLETLIHDDVYTEFLSGGTRFLSAKVANICLKQANAYFNIPAFVGSATAYEQVGKLVNNCFTEKRTVEEAFQEAIDTCKATD